MDLTSEFNQIAQDLNQLWRKIITDKGLVESGRLLNSINWVVKKEGNNYKLSMTSEDYYKYLDKDYGITKAALATAEYLRIKERIAKIYAIMITSDIVNSTK
jgi:hypothetical protein